MKSNSKCKWVRLGDYITQCDERNTENKYGKDSVRGLAVSKGMIETKANLMGVSLTSYKLVKPMEFAYVPDTSRRGDKVSMGMNDTTSTFLVSSISCVFKVTDTEKLLPDYLYLLFCRPEFDRYARFNSWGSACEAFSYDEMCRVEIPLPSLADQQKVVNAWKSLREVKEQNEAIAAPLMQVCQSYIQELKHKYKAVEIGEFIEEIDERNADLKIKLSQGIANTKVFQDPKQVSVNSKSDKIVRHGYFGYNRATTRNGEKISIAYRDGEECTVSSAYRVFRITDESILNPHFLWMWFSRSEFDRYARYMSKGSAHEFFEMDEMRRVRIPLPPLSVQQAIVNIYNCANEAKRIAAEADRMSREVCPALIQHVINS